MKIRSIIQCKAATILILLLYSCDIVQSPTFSPCHQSTPEVTLNSLKNSQYSDLSRQNMLTIYNDGLMEPWINASWSASVDFNNTEQVYNGTYSIRVDQNAWGGLGIHHGAWGSSIDIRAEAYGQIEFAIFTPEDTLSINLMAGNRDGDTFRQARYGTVYPDQWTEIAIPISELNPGGHVIHRITIMEASGQKSTYFVDGWRLAGEGNVVNPNPEPDRKPLPGDPNKLFVYNEELIDPWTNSSWNANIDFNNFEEFLIGTRSIRVNQNSWGGLSVQHGTWGSPIHIGPNEYKHVEFAIKAVDEPVTLTLHLQNSEGKSFPRIPCDTWIKSGNWTVVSVPISRLNPDGHNFHRINILETSGEPRKFYMDAWWLKGRGDGSSQ